MPSIIQLRAHIAKTTLPYSALPEVQQNFPDLEVKDADGNVTDVFPNEDWILFDVRDPVKPKILCSKKGAEYTTSDITPMEVVLSELKTHQQKLDELDPNPPPGGPQ